MIVLGSKLIRANRATVAFAVTAVVIAVAFAADRGYTVGDAVFVVVSGAIGALFGRLLWRLLVVSNERWSVPVRGAIAGAIVGLFSLPLGGTVFLVSRTDTIGDPVVLPTGIDEIVPFGTTFLSIGAAGVIYLGWIVVPGASLVGYLLGCEYRTDDTSGTNPDGHDDL